jgi:hypothetical protein
MNYKRAFVIVIAYSTFHSVARTLFLIGEAHEDVRFLMRRSLCTPKQ